MPHAYASLHRAKMEAYNQLVLIGKQSLEVLTSDGGEALFFILLLISSKCYYPHRITFCYEMHMHSIKAFDSPMLASGSETVNKVKESFLKCQQPLVFTKFRGRREPIC